MSKEKSSSVWNGSEWVGPASKTTRKREDGLTPEEMANDSANQMSDQAQREIDEKQAKLPPPYKADPIVEQDNSEDESDDDSDEPKPHKKTARRKK